MRLWIFCSQHHHGGLTLHSQSQWELCSLLLWHQGKVTGDFGIAISWSYLREVIDQLYFWHTGQKTGIFLLDPKKRVHLRSLKLLCKAASGGERQGRKPAWFSDPIPCECCKCRFPSCCSRPHEYPGLGEKDWTQRNWHTKHLAVMAPGKLSVGKAHLHLNLSWPVWLKQLPRF